MTKPIFARSSRFPFLPTLALVAAAGTGTPTDVSAQVLQKAPPGAGHVVEAPLSLTASDGAGLELVSLSAQAVVEDPLAFTELHLVFRNPESRVREGRFRITLPSGATISRFAMRVGDRWQEGEVVEQQAARIAYEDFLHRRQDPALLESEAGNEFSARVFPIPPNATKELVVSYSQELRAVAEPYRLPLVGLPKLGRLAVRALVGKVTGPHATAPASNLGGQRAQYDVVEVEKRDFKPDRDFEVAHGGVAGRLGLRNDNLVVARVVPFAGTTRRDEVGSLFVLIDTSASRALGLAQQVAAVEGLVSELRKAGDPMISVAAFDQDVAPLYTGKASGMAGSVRERILQRRALGASDIDRALAWLATAAAKDKRSRVLLVTDGVATAGEASAEKLRARVKALAAAGVERLDVLAVGGIREDALLARLVTAGLARDGVVIDGTQPSALAAARLTRATRSGLKVEIDGAGWVWPNVLDGVQAGDEMLVYADLPAGKPLRVKVAGQVLPLVGTLAPVERPLLERAWVHARIARLIEMRDAPEKFAGLDRDMADALKKQAIELSVKYRVLCPFTSLLVLETEQDYARFGIERRALADILTVGAGGITVAHRADFALTATMAEAGRAVSEQALPALAKAAKGGKDETGSANRAPLEQASREAESDGPRGANLARADVEKMEMDDSISGLTSGGGAPSTRGIGHLRARPGNEGAAAPAAAPPPPVARSAPRPEAREVARPAQAMDRKKMARVSGAMAFEPEAPFMPAPPPAPVAPPALPSMSGVLKEVMDLIHHGDPRAALNKALAWRARDAGDVLALVALGECWEALGDATQAGRAYGSIIDLFPGRADMRRFAGERLERVRGASALALAVDTYRKAVEQRPDHPASHRLLGFALLKQGHPREAFEAIAVGAARRYPAGRFRGVERILSEDLGLAAAAWMRAEPAHADDIRARLARAGGTAESAPSVRFVLNWETDANDVDFHIHDGKGGHAFYSAPQLPSGGELYADVTTGYGPECFTIRNAPSARAFPYRLQAHYYSRGPMGYGMGKLQVIEHDGKGGLRFDERPFVIMQDGAFVELGTVSGNVQTVAAQIVRKPVLAR
ncbi:MAG TPA: VIT domain-containing protein [Polyangia bacterium]|jgi:tetratricopeptide (TPR) repeat protein